MITLKNVTKEYDKGNIGLTDVSLDVEKGEFVFIVGKSGSGKTTLMKLLQKELEPTSGQIIVNGQNYKELKRRELPKLRRQMGMVFQDFRLLKDRTIFENVAFAQKVVEAPNRYIKRQVENMLDMVGLKDRMKAFPNELSGGEQQRVAIARALVMLEQESVTRFDRSRNNKEGGNNANRNNKKKKKGNNNNGNRPQQQAEGGNRPQQPQRENENCPQQPENGNRGERDNRPRNNNNNNRNRGQNQGRNNENRRPERGSNQERPQGQERSNQERPQQQDRQREQQGQERQERRPNHERPSRPERNQNQEKQSTNEKPTQE